MLSRRHVIGIIFIYFGLFTKTIFSVEQCPDPCLIYVNNTDINRYGDIFGSFTTTKPFPLQTMGHGNIKAFDYHYAKRFFLWYNEEENKMFSIGFQGNNLRELTGLTLGKVTGLAIDWNYDLVYWIDEQFMTLSVSTLTGEHQSVVIKGVPGLVPVTVSYGGKGHVFSGWKAGEQFKLRKHSHTSNDWDIHTGKIPISMAVDVVRQMVYLGYNDGVTRMNFNGQRVVHVATNHKIQSLTIGYTTGSFYLYYINRGQKKLMKMKHVGTAMTKIDEHYIQVSSVSTDDRFMLYDSQSQNSVEENTCDEIECEQLCLYAITTASFACACQIGYTLNADKKTCDMIAKSASIEFLTYTQTSLQLSNVYTVPGLGLQERTLNVPNVVGQNVGFTDEMFLKGSDLYHVDKTNKLISRYNIEEDYITILKTQFTIDGKYFDYDDVSKIFYFVHSNHRTLMVASVSGQVKSLANTSNSVLALKVASSIGYIVTLEQNGKDRHIRVYYLNGERIFTRKLNGQYIETFFMDEKQNRILFFNAGTNTINTYTLFSTNEQVWMNNVNKLNYMAISGDSFIYLLNNKELYMLKTWKSNPSPNDIDNLKNAKTDMKVIVPIPATTSVHPCTVNNGGCSHFCLRKSGEVECGCPNDMFLADEDKKTCATTKLTTGFPMEIAGSKWAWLHDSQTADGSVIFTRENKVSWLLGASQGSWEYNDQTGILKATFNGIYHELEYDQENRKAILKKPARNPPSTMILESEVIINEGTEDTIKCPVGRYINILYASYGNPPNCHAATSMSVVQGKCQQKMICTLIPRNSDFGDPCYLTYKTLRVVYECLESVDDLSILGEKCPSPCLYFSNKRSIYRAPLSVEGDSLFTQPQQIFSMGTDIKMLAVDHKEDIMFWSDLKQIYKADSQAKNMEVFHDIGVQDVRGITVDNKNQVVYWTDYSQNTISVKGYWDEGYHALPINELVENPSTIVVDPSYAGGLIFWINAESTVPYVSSSSIKGTNVKLVKNLTNAVMPHSLQIDTSSRLLYIATNNGVIRMMYFGQSEKLYPAGTYVNGFAFYRTKSLFYFPSTDRLISKKFGNDLENRPDIPVSDMDTNTTIGIIVESEQPSSLCTDDKCPNAVCLNGGYCACYAGYYKESSTGLCKEDTTPKYDAIVLSSSSTFHRYKKFETGLTVNKINPLYTARSIHTISIVLDTSYEEMYWINWGDSNDAIMKMNFDGSDVISLVMRQKDITTLKYDQINFNLYWIESDKIYRCSSLDGSEIYEVYKESKQGERRDLMIDARDGLLFTYCYDTVTETNIIYQGTTQGTPEVAILKQYLYIHKITLDTYGKKLYYIASSASDSLYMVNYDGTDKRIIDTIRPQYLHSLEIIQSNAYINEAFSETVLIIDKLSGKYQDTVSVTAHDIDSAMEIEILGKYSEETKYYLEAYTYSYASSTEVCSTSDACAYGATPQDPDACPNGYISEVISEDMCAKCDQALGNSLACICEDWVSCSHRYASNVTCTTNKPFLRLKARQCLQEIRAGICPYYDCSSRTTNPPSVCNVDADCFDDDMKCCETNCGKKCLPSSLTASTSQCSVNNGGCSEICIPNNKREAVCRCPEGMVLNSDNKTCKFQSGICTTNVCNGSPCVETDDGYTCQCTPPSTGDNCEMIKHCLSNPCNNGATCTENDGGYACGCAPGFKGDNCDLTENICDVNQCLHGGSCVPYGDGTSYRCECQSGYLGEYCENLNPCTSSPCKNGASCVPNEAGTNYQCICDSGYSGDNCEIQDFCISSPCQHGASCVPNEAGTNYQCICGSGYSGDNCEIIDKVDDICKWNTCEHGGSCSSDDNGTDYLCSCMPGYTGTNCEKLEDICESTPCENGGSCFPSNTPKGFTCQCSLNYIGETCSNPHPCFQGVLCLNGGTCALAGDSYKCLCPNLYTGNTCQTYYGDNLASVVLKPESGVKITKSSFQVTMAQAYTEYCSEYDCINGNVPSQLKRKRRSDTVIIEAKHIIVVMGYPKEVGEGEVQVLYTVVIPVSIETKDTKLINVESLLKGADEGSEIISTQLKSTYVATEKYTQPEAKKEEDSDNLVLIGAAAGGGVLVLIVLIVTIGCCVVKRKDPKNVHITLDNPANGTQSVYLGKFNHRESQADPRYTTHVGYPPQQPFTMGRSQLGAAPPIPDYPTDDQYEGIQHYAASNDAMYLESNDIKGAAETSYMGLNQRQENDYTGLSGLTVRNNNEEGYITPNLKRVNGQSVPEDILAKERERSRQQYGMKLASDVDDSYMSYNKRISTEEESYMDLKKY